MRHVTGGQSLARIFAAVEGFYVDYGYWPSSVRITPSYLEHLRNHVLSDKEFDTVERKLRFIPDSSATVIAEGEDGTGYDYGSRGFPKSKPPVRAREWLELNTSNSQFDADAFGAGQ